MNGLIMRAVAVAFGTTAYIILGIVFASAG
jgi:hypothetical protein